MAIGSGLGASLGIADETTYATAVSPTRWLEFTSESLGLTKGIVQGEGLRGSGLYARSQRRANTTRSASGDVTMEVATRGMGLLYKHMLGTSTSTLISGSSYQQVHVPGSLAGKSFTVQKLVPQTDGVQKPFTYRGCKVLSWTLTCETGGKLMLTLSLDAADEGAGTANGGVAAGTPSYTASEIFHFRQGAILLGGTVATTSGVAAVTGGTAVARVNAATVTGSNGMKTDSFHLGGAGVKSEPLENAWRTVGGTLTAEFASQAAIYDVMDADTQTAMVLRFTGTTAISGSNYPTLEVLVPSIHFDGESPKVAGTDVVTMASAFTGSDNGTDAAVQIRSVTADTAV